jgi:sec-independent protein translocase protein TatA
MPSIGIGELIIVLVIILVLFGATRVPELARSLGRGVNEFKGGLKDRPDEIESESSQQESEPKDRSEQPLGK